MKLFAFLLLASTAFGVSIPNSHQDTGTGTAISSTSFTATSGDTIFLLCATGSGQTLNAPTDAGGNTYTAVQGQTAIGTSISKTWVATKITGFTGSVTCHTAASTFQLVEYMELSGVGPTDVTSVADKTYTATASPWATNTLTTTNANDVIITYIVNDNVSHTYTAPAGFTIPSGNNQTNVAFAYQVIGATVSQTYSWTGTGAADNMIVGILALTLPPASHPPLLF